MSEISNSKSIIDEAPIGYAKTDESCRIIDANRKLASLLGVERNSLFNLPLVFFISQAYRDAFYRHINDLKQSLTEQIFLTQMHSSSGQNISIQMKSTCVTACDNAPIQIHFYITDITEQVLLEDALRERIKELTCLYSISALHDIPETYRSERMERAVAMIPPAWKYPEIAAARIVIQDKIFQTTDFTESKWRLIRPIQVNHAHVGYVEVVYLQQNWHESDSPFLPEEEHLISAIASELGRMIERIWTHEVQQESDRLLGLAQVVARVGYYSLDIAKGTWTSSPVLNSLMGIDDSVEKNIDTWISIVVPDYRPILLERLYEVVKKGLRWDVEYEIIRPSDGKQRWLSAQGEFDYDETGNPTHLSGFIQDITERKQLELRQQRQRKILELMALGSPLDVVLKEICDEFEKEFEDSKIVITTAAEMKECIHNSFSGTCESAGWSHNIISKEGDLLGTFCVYFSEPTQLAVEKIDIMKDASHLAGIAIKNLMQQEQLRKLSLAVEQSPAAVVITDIDGTITYVNKKFTQVSGYEFAEAVGNNPRILKTSQTQSEVFTDLWKTIKAGNVWEGEFVNKKKNGEHYWEKALINPIFNENNVITHYLAIKEDITEFKHNQLLLHQAKEAAESANRMKSAFIANVSHEIRTPMNAILGFTEMLMRDSSLTEQQMQHLSVIEKSGEHLLELINDVLEMSKIESGHASINASTFNSRLLLRDLESMFRIKANEKNLQLSFAAEPSLPPLIIADKQKLRQILINLIGNAIKFTDLGKVSVIMGAAPVFERPGQYKIFVDVEDTGLGIAKEEINQLFLLFSQTSGGSVKGGTGLGLAISRSFARMMGGDITFTSQLGRGSCFHVEIIAEQGSSDSNFAVNEGKPIELYPGQTVPKILIVDDEELNRQILVGILNKIGFDTIQAANGEAAVDALVEWRPDLILMDIQMPVMNGYEATRRIKMNTAGKNVPVIGLSAGVFEEDRLLALQSGMDDFVPKPFKSQSLLHTIAKYLSLEYLYEEANKGEGLVDVELETIPQDLLEQIRVCAGSADYDELMKAIDRIDKYSNHVAGHLRILANRYDYEACVEMIERKRT